MHKNNPPFLQDLEVGGLRRMIGVVFREQAGDTIQSLSFQFNPPCKRNPGQVRDRRGPLRTQQRRLSANKGGGISNIYPSTQPIQSRVLNPFCKQSPSLISDDHLFILELYFLLPVRANVNFMKRWWYMPSTPD